MVSGQSQFCHQHLGKPRNHRVTVSSPARGSQSFLSPRALLRRKVDMPLLYLLRTRLREGPVERRRQARWENLEHSSCFHSTCQRGKLEEGNGMGEGQLTDSFIHPSSHSASLYCIFLMQRMLYWVLGMERCSKRSSSVFCWGVKKLFPGVMEPGSEDE